MASAVLLDLSPLRDDRTFRNLFVARTILLSGVGVVLVTVPLEVYARTGSTLAVSAVAAVESLAFLVGFLGGGVLADRGDRWRLVIVSWLVCGLAFAALAGNAVWVSSTVLTAVFVAINGLSGAVCLTAMLAVIPAIVDREKMHAVGALNTVSLRLGSVLAPAVGGLVFAASSAAWNYGAGAAAAFLTWVLLLVSPPPGTGGRAGAAAPTELTELTGPTESTGPTGPTERESPLRALRTGARFVVREPVVLGVMVAGVVGMLGGGSVVLVPAFVEARFGGSPVAVGLIYSALSVGLVAGSLGSGWVRGRARPGLLLLGLMIACFACYVAAGAAPTLLLVLVAFVAAGATNALEEVLRYTLLQLRSPDALLGRVNSLFSAQGMAGAAVGAVVAGVVGGLVGAADALWIYNTVLAGLAVVTAAALGPLRAATRESIERKLA
jgi:MFS transporter, ENTS family, enterobactin (siderophore) exporter